MTLWGRAMRAASLFAFVWVCSTSALYGQAVYGSISGTVYDSSGGAVPGARVTITDLGRDQNYLTVTNQDGYYNQTHLIVGQYRVRVEAAGFNASVQDMVSVSVDSVTSIDVHLTPGDVSQTVDVKEEVPLLKTERTDVSTTFS